MRERKNDTRLEVEFVGKNYLTKAGGICTVLPWKGLRDKRSVKIFELTCSICSKDSELFPKGFTSVPASLRQNKIPCGCSGIYKWNTSQYKLLVERKLRSISANVSVRYLGDEPITSKTLVDISCPNNHSQVKRVKVSKILNENFTYLCTECNRLHSRPEISDFNITRKFYETGKFEGCTFTRNTERRGEKGSLIYWDYTCPICSNDRYVAAGLCSGIFTSQAPSIRGGNKSCRCSSVYRWTKEQREFQIQEECNKTGKIFIDWCNGEYKNSSSGMEWLCRKGHKNCNTTTEFISGADCTSCNYQRKTVYGYGGGGLMSTRLEEKDFLYILLCKDNGTEFIKVGRSINVDSRIKSLITISGSDISCLAVYTSTHFQIYGLEQSIHYLLKSLGNYYPVSWTVEGFTKESVPIIETLLSELNITRVT